MQYRSFGQTGFTVSALGFGTMRLPLLGENAAEVDFAEATRLIRYAIDRGVNYVDTAYPYHSGQSEVAVAKALEDGYRARVAIADKLPTWLVKEESDVERLLDEQLARLKTDHIEFYLVHNLNRVLWPVARDHNVLAVLEKAREKGKIGHLGFSFHDTFSQFKEIVDAYNGWEFVQVQYNYVNETVQAGTEGVRYAASKGLPVVVMEPLLGGCLVNPPEPVRAELVAWPGGQRSPVDWALQWLWNRSEIATVLSGMGALSQVEENLACAEASGAGRLSEEELEIVRRAALAYHEMNPIPCTKCRYCMPCPHGIDIPRNFELYNGVKVFGGNQQLLNPLIYQNFFDKTARAELCTQCGECLPKCPQHIRIPELMPAIHAALSGPLSR